MNLETIRIDRSQLPPAIHFGPGFNVAVPFIDRHIAEGRGGKVAIRCAAGDVTYAELARNVNRCGNALLGLGIKRGDRALMVMKDCPEFFYVFWGAIKAGIVPVPLNTLLRAKDYQFFIEDSQCAAVVWSSEYAGEVMAGLKACQRPPPAALQVDGGGQSLRALIEQASDDLAAVPSAATAACFWLYSSGSTGRPKGAVHRQRDMVITSQRYSQDMLGVREGDVLFSAPKLFFAYGLGSAMTFPLWAGATAVLLDAKPTPQNTFEIMERYRPTHYFGVPTLYAAQLHALDNAQQKPDVSSVKVFVSGGEPLPADLFRRWKEHTGVGIIDGIGSTEALHVFISTRPDDIRLNTTGKLVPGYEARILLEDGTEAPPKTPGRLQIRGHSTAAYYWNNPEKTAATMLPGDWLDTGDTYLCDDDGYFQYCGRSDDMLKVGGIWCSPIEIEATLVSHPKVLEVAVIGALDQSGLQKPEAFVVVKEPGTGSEELSKELMQYCKARLAAYKFPRSIQFVAELPKTATGKIQRFRLRQLAEAPPAAQ